MAGDSRVGALITLISNGITNVCEYVNQVHNELGFRISAAVQPHGSGVNAGNDNQVDWDISTYDDTWLQESLSRLLSTCSPMYDSGTM